MQHAPLNLGRLPSWVTPDVLADTRATWESLYRRALSDEEVLGIVLAAANLFRILSADDDDNHPTSEAQEGPADEAQQAA